MHILTHVIDFYLLRPTPVHIKVLFQYPIVGKQCLRQTEHEKKLEPVGSDSSQGQCRSRVSRRRISKLDRAAKRCAQGERAVIVNEQVIGGFVEGDRDVSPNFVAVELIFLGNKISGVIVR